MKKTLPKGDANRALVLQALRAGPMTAMEMAERWSFGSSIAQQLCRAGLVEVVGDEYRMTNAGRAACPFRNPLAAKAADQPEVFTMPKGETHVTRQQVLAVILAGGPSGATRKELLDKFAGRATEQAIDMHITALNRQQPAVVYKPRPGLLIDIRLKPAGACDQDSGKNAPQTALTATDEGEAALTVAEPVGEPLPPIAGAIKAQIGERMPAVVEDMTISDPDTTEFAIYSSGGLDIFTDDCAITLQKPVLDKLRAFLGLFAEAA